MEAEAQNVASKVDDTTFGANDWNKVVNDCRQLDHSKWETISSYLGLSHAKISIIKQDHPNNNTGCWNEALQQWIAQNYNIEMFSMPSWKALVEAIAKINKLQAKGLAAKHQQGTESHILDVAKSGSLNCKSSSQSTSSDPSLTPEKKLQLQEQVSSGSQDMKFQFQELFASTRASLRQRNVPVAELIEHLDCLGSIKPTYKDTNLPALRQQLPKLENAKTADDIMSVIKNYCSFFNYRMVEHIINKFGTEKDKDSLTCYKEEFKMYAECCVISCPMEVCTTEDDNHSKMFVVIDDSFENCTPSHLHIFIGHLRKVLKLSSQTVLNLYNIDPGSIKLTFGMSTLVQRLTFPLSCQQEYELESLGVMQLSCEGYKYISQKVLRKHSVQPVNTVSKETKSKGTAAVAGLALEKAGDSDCESNTDSAVGSDYTGTTAEETHVSEDLLDRDLSDDEDNEGQYASDDSLHRAAYKGDLVEVKRLTERRNFNPLDLDKYGRNVIHYAAKGGQIETLKYFIEEKGYDPISQGRDGWTTLHIAAQFNQLEVVEYLIFEHMANVSCRTKNGSTPLHKACAGGHIHIVQFLINEMCKKFPIKYVTDCKSNDGQSPMHHAALYGHLGIVDFLITEMKCDPNMQLTEKGRTPLHSAAQNGHLHLVKYLIEKQKCNPRHLDDNKITPLHMAAREGHISVVKYLTLNQNCNPLCTSNDSDTPLHAAAKYGHLRVVKFLIEAFHCPLDIKGKDNKTPLDLANIHGHHHVIEYLQGHDSY